MISRTDYIPEGLTSPTLHRDHRNTTESGMKLDPTLRAMMDTAGAVPLYRSATVVVFALGLVGWFVIRMADFDIEDWLGACEVLGPDTMIDCGAWEVWDDLAFMLAVERAVIINPDYEAEVSHLQVVAS